MIRLLLAVTLFSLTIIAAGMFAAAHAEGWRVHSSKLRIVDGDSVANGSSMWRLAGIDAPEVNQGCAAERELGRKAKARVQELVVRNKTIAVQLAGKDKYGRRLARLSVGGKDVASTLVAEGLAVPYSGVGPRPAWC